MITQTYYRIENFLKFAEEDDYKEGCLMDTRYEVFVNISIKAKNKKELLKKVAETLFCNAEDIVLNSCDENGRIDISFMENEQGHTASKQEIKEWSKGKIKLWSCIYTAHVKKITEEEVNL